MFAAVAALGLACMAPHTEHLFFGSTLIGVRRNGRWKEVGASNGPLGSHVFHQIGLAKPWPEVKVDGLRYDEDHLWIGASNKVPYDVVLFNGNATLPRPVKVLSEKSPTYLAVIRRFLAAHGIHNEAKLDQVVSADLDGDGKDEVFLVGSSIEKDQDLNLKHNFYSVVLLRHIVAAQVVDQVVEFDHHRRGQVDLSLWHRVAAIADFEGDGIMEFVLTRRMPDTHFASLMRFQHGRLRTIVDNGFGF